MVFCRILRYFVIYAVLSRNMFLAIHALLRGDKFYKKLCPWRKNDKYEVWLLQLATCPSRFEFSSQSLNLLSKSDRSQETIETLYGIQIKAKVSLLNLENILHIDHKDFFGKYAQHNLVWVCVGGIQKMDLSNLPQ